MPKPQAATTEDVAEVKDELVKNIDEIRAAVPFQLAELEKKLQFAIDAVTGAVKHNQATTASSLQQLTSEAKTREGELENRVVAQIAALTKSVNELSAAQSSLQPKLDDLRTSLFDSLNKEVGALCEKIDAEFDSLRGLVQSADDKGGQTTFALMERTKVLETKLQETQDALQKQTALQEAESKRLDEAVEEQKKVDAGQDESARSSYGEIHIRIDKIREAMKEQTIMSKSSANKAAEELKTKVESLQRQIDENFDHMTQTLASFSSHIEVVENLSTRRADWLLEKASRFLHDGGKQNMECCSPTFTVGGGRDLRLELRMKQADDDQSPGMTKSTSVRESSAAGDCCVILRGSPGMRFSCRLFIGEQSEVVEADFPLGTARKEDCQVSTRVLGFLKDMINEDGNLHVGVEFLELCHEAAASSSASEAEASADASGDAPPEPAAQPEEGSITFARHVQFNMLDEVRRHCELMRSAMVRHVHWRLENASSLKQHFGVGEALCSIPFNAAGIEGMQFVFYPSGYSGASDGQSSLFLYCPAGTMLKAMLSLGSRRWESTNHFKEGHAFGRTNFARLEKVIDEADDSLVLGLEIESAKCETQASTRHAASANGAATANSKGSVADDGLDATHSSTIKLVKSFNGGLSAVLEGARLLPSIWTSKPISDLLKRPHGYQSLSVFEPSERGRAGGKGGKRGPNGGRSTSPSDRQATTTQDGIAGQSSYDFDTSGGAELRGSESMPSLGGGNSSALPLPRLVGVSPKQQKLARRQQQAALFASPLKMATTC
mmetsp:Transcript_13519/g.31806  ORF Transcript_13519/g.31806 Transcript_13519/m.31806 type:complete len:781 (+) Transcript_13519:48-2390(+)